MTFLVFLLLIIASQLIGRRALSRLSAEEKARAVDFGLGRGVWVLAAIAVVYAVQLGITHFVGYPAWLLPAFSITLLFVIFVAFGFEFMRLARSGLPSSYVRSIGLTYILLIAGLVAVFAKDLLHVVRV